MKKLSVLVVAHNEEAILADCLDRLTFADELIIVLDKCTDGTRDIALKYTDEANLIEGSWDLEGPRRNIGIAACSGDWVLEIDADEHVPAELADEIRHVMQTSISDYHNIPVDNYIAGKLVRYGWGASFGVSSTPRLFRAHAKKWGEQRIHPSLMWVGRDGKPAVKGPVLKYRLDHFVDTGVSDMILRLDRYATARAADLRDSGNVGTLLNNVRRLFSRFIKCYIGRKGYKEGGWGLLIALCAGLFPLLSYLKATLEDGSSPKR